MTVALPAMFFLLLPVINSDDGIAWFNLSIAIVYGVLVFPWTIVRYLRFRYSISATEIKIRSGVTTVNRRNIPVDRVQNIEVEQSILQRLTGTARVSIFTAGSASAEGVLEVVSLAEAHRVRDSIRRLQGAAAPAGNEGADAAGHALQEDGAPAEAARAVITDGLAGVYGTDGRTARPGLLGGVSADSAEPVFAMSLRRVILSGVFRFSLVYIAIFYTLVQYVEPDPEAMINWLARGRFDGVREAAADSPGLAIGLTVAIAFLFAWLSGIAVNLNKYYGFTLTADGSKLHHRQGLLSRHAGTIPLRKVQAFIIRTNPLMRYFGWYRLEVQTMGFDVKERGHKVAVPFGRLEDVLRAANTIQLGLPHPDPEGIRIPETLPVSMLTIRRAFIRYSVAISVAAGGLWYFWTPGVWLLTLLPLALVAAVLRYKHLGYGEDEHWLYVRRGVIKQHLWLLPLERSQVFYQTASLFQRRLRLASLYVDAAGASSIRPAEVVDLPEDVARSILERSYARFQEIMLVGSADSAPAVTPIPGTGQPG
jgi:putative membrane protein